MKSKSAAQKTLTTIQQDPISERQEQISKIVSLVENIEPSQETVFATGRQVTLAQQGEEDQLIVTNPEGEIELSVRFTSTGPVLNFSSASIRMKTPGLIDMDCGQLKIRAKNGIDLKTEGNFEQQIEGQNIVRCQRGSIHEAGSVTLRAQKGDVRLKANDDVKIDGERVLLNS